MPGKSTAERTEGKKKPRCETCKGTANVQAVPRPGVIPGSYPALRWLCGDCQYREDHPDAARIAKVPKPKVPQVETLDAPEPLLP